MSSGVAGWAPVAGAYVRSTKAPSWGVGKVALVEGGTMFVFFRDYDGKSPDDARTAKRFPTTNHPLEPAEVASDPVLDNFPPFERRGTDLLLPHQRLTIAAAKKKFFDHFPGGFRGAEYIGTAKTGERHYKLDAHQKFVDTLGGGALLALLDAGEISEAAQRARAVLAPPINLLSTFESSAFRDALNDAAGAEQYLRGLQQLLDAPEITAVSFEAYLRGFFALRRVGAARVHSWVVCTALPYLAAPTRFMHLAPEKTNIAANLLAFDLRYDAKPNWETYQRLLAMAELLHNELSDLGCQDMIDVQSFIWIACGGYDPKPSKTK